MSDNDTGGSERIEKEWIAIPKDGEEEVVARADTRSELIDELGMDTCPTCGHLTIEPDEYVVVAVPKPHTSVVL